MEQGRAILESLFGRGIHAFGDLRVLEEFVGGGDDALDLGAGLRFQQWQGLDEEGLVGEVLGSLFQARQSGPGPNALLEGCEAAPAEQRAEEGGSH